MSHSLIANIQESELTESYRPSRFALGLKRILDIVGASVVLVSLSPCLIATAFLVRLDGYSAIFRQKRVGKGGKEFTLYKFRSMQEDAEASIRNYLACNPKAAAEWQKFHKIKGSDQHLTKVGGALRRSSIDELPQLINILKGEMSLVGPRPILPEERSVYGSNLIFYQSVRPGLTGPWQVSGRNKLTMQQRIALECEYARNWNMWTDIVILWRTLPAVLRKEESF